MDSVLSGIEKEKPTDQATQLKGRKFRYILQLSFILIGISILRVFFIDSFKITSDSMEGTLLVNDDVFVAKYYYGARLPSSFGLPLFHNEWTIAKLFNLKFNTGEILPYLRLPKYASVKRREIIAFNAPVEDGPPVDYKTVYIKRCVAIPLDRVAVKGGVVYVNDIKQPMSTTSYRNYELMTKRNLDPRDFAKFGIIDFNSQVRMTNNFKDADKRKYTIDADIKTYHALRKSSIVESIRPVIAENRFNDLDIYPGIYNQRSNKDFIPELTIPGKDLTINLDSVNSAYYYRVIHDYEGVSNAKLTNRIIFVDQKPLLHYRFRNNYYYCLGDNATTSYDSRYWGVVPERNLVGKVMAIWFSTANDGIRWNRIFKKIE